MFALVVRFDLTDESAAAGFDAMVAAMLPEIEAHEPGTLVYATHRVEGEPLARVFYEVYASRAAHAEHEKQPHVATFLQDRGRFVTTTQVQFLEVGASTGVPGMTRL